MGNSKLTRMGQLFVFSSLFFVSSTRLKKTQSPFERTFRRIYSPQLFVYFPDSLFLGPSSVFFAEYSSVTRPWAMVIHHLRGKCIPCRSNRNPSSIILFVLSFPDFMILNCRSVFSDSWSFMCIAKGLLK